MPLSPPKARRHLHTRTIDLTGYYRDDGLFDIEAHIVDRKTYSYDSQWRGVVASGHPVHDMSLRLSVDGDLVVREVEAVMDVQPYTICSEVLDNFQRLVGLRIGAGWNKRVREAVGGVEGCTHLGELLGPLATVTFQTLSGDYPRELMGKPPRQRGAASADGANDGEALFMLNGCHTWRSDSPVVQRDYPAHYTGVDAVKIVGGER
ncbi:MAG: DUF2889 domain-containing protein [Porticoccaceae bacterium]|nr:MAG: DUF2889 domain-containing protein [Porticoccaceae bacterium]